MILFFSLTSHFKILKTFTSSSKQYQSKLSFSHRESVHLSSFMHVLVIALWCPLEVRSAGMPVIRLYGSWWFPSVLSPSFLLLLNQHILLPWSAPFRSFHGVAFFARGMQPKLPRPSSSPLQVDANLPSVLTCHLNVPGGVLPPGLHSRLLLGNPYHRSWWCRVLQWRCSLCVLIIKVVLWCSFQSGIW